MQEIPLTGGNLNLVVRIGDTVRRPPSGAAVQGLLRHLEAQGFDGAPHFLGIDEKGREVLSFIPGEAGFLPFVYTDVVLLEAARLLRRFHDATAGYVAPEGAKWQMAPFGGEGEVICHNDFAPYNLIFQEQKPVALIDFDLCGPGPRLWDMAFAAYWLVPLSFSGDLSKLSRADLENGSRRLQLFGEAYGIAVDTRLLDMVEERLQFLCDWLESHAAAGEAAYVKMVAEGHLAHYQKEVAAFREVRGVLEENLLEF